MSNFADGIWDDGEWISWDRINSQLEDQELHQQYPEADVDVVRVFPDLIDVARENLDTTGRYLRIWGELGELYGEVKYGLERHALGNAGSDGRLGNDWVEVNTISPEKAKNSIQVKRAGNFDKLLVRQRRESGEGLASLFLRKPTRLYSQARFVRTFALCSKSLRADRKTRGWT